MPVGKILFPPFTIDSLDLGLLAAGSGVFIIALTVAQALLALKGHAPAALAWFLGVARRSSLVTAAVEPCRTSRCRSSSASSPGRRSRTLVMVLSLYSRMKRGVPESVDSLITQIEHEPLEI